MARCNLLTITSGDGSTFLSGSALSNLLPWTSQPNLLLLMPGEACWEAGQAVYDRDLSSWRPGQWLTVMFGRRA